MKAQNISIGKATLNYVVLAVGAIAASYVAGWATDRFFGSRRAPVICLLLVCLGLLTLAYEHVSQISAWGTIGLLVVIGFCIYGPQVLLVGTAPADLAKRGTAGEWRRKSYIGVIAELAHGFELSRNPADGRPWTVVVDKLSPKHPGFIAKEVAFLKKLTKRDIKATLPAPALLGERMWDPV